MDFTSDAPLDENSFSINGNTRIKNKDPILIADAEIKKDSIDASKAATATDEAAISKEKMTPIRCTMCDARILYEKSAESHFDGNKHKRKVKRYQLMKAVAKEFGIAIQDPDPTEEKKSFFNQISFLEKQVEKFLYCTTCNISVTGFDNMLVHLSSMKHHNSTAMRTTKISPNNSSNNPSSRPPRPQFSQPYRPPSNNSHSQPQQSKPKFRPNPPPSKGNRNPFANQNFSRPQTRPKQMQNQSRFKSNMSGGGQPRSRFPGPQSGMNSDSHSYHAGPQFPSPNVPRTQPNPMNSYQPNPMNSYQPNQMNSYQPNQRNSYQPNQMNSYQPNQMNSFQSNFVENSTIPMQNFRTAFPRQPMESSQMSPQKRRYVPCDDFAQYPGFPPVKRPYMDLE